MSTTEETPPSAGRTRRSAAVKGKSAWASLLPHKKSGMSSDVESENVEEPIKKESPKKAQIPVETVSQKRARVGGKKPRLSKTEKVNSHVEMSPTAKSPEAKPPAKDITSSPAKQPATTPAASPPKKENEANPVLKAAPSPAKPSSAVPPVSTVRPYRTPQPSYSMNAGYAAALNKEQLQEIEREVDKHLDGEFDGNEEEEDDDRDEGTTKFVLDDPDDEDFNLSCKKSTKRKSNGDAYPASKSYTPRGGSQSGRGRGRPKGSLNIPKPSGGGIMRGIGKMGSRPSSLGTPPTIMLNSNSLARPASNNTASKPNAFVVSSRDGADVNQSAGQVDRRSLKVVRIRQAGPQQIAQRVSASYQPHSHGSTTTSGLNKEISEISEKYHNRVVPGTTVQQFNEIVNQLSQELMRMVSEQANHRQYTDQLALSHAAQIELKDEKIRHLEHTVEVLQSKLLVSFKKNQLNVLKNETAADKQDEKPNGAAIYGSSPSSNEIQKKRQHDPEEFEPTRKAPRFSKDFDDQDEEPFSGSGLDGDDEDTEVDEEGITRQVTL